MMDNALQLKYSNISIESVKRHRRTQTLDVHRNSLSYRRRGFETLFVKDITPILYLLQRCGVFRILGGASSLWIFAKRGRAKKRPVAASLAVGSAVHVITVRALPWVHLDG